MDPRVEDITRDFLERDGRTFVRKRRTGRIGWEGTLEKGESLSSYFLKSPTDGEVIDKAYSIAQDMIKAMDTPYRVKIRLEPRGTVSATDFKSVWVATDFFDRTDLTPGQKIDIFTGYTIHEGCHLLYTDHGADTPSDKLVFNLYNTIEDERIEMLLGESSPGLANYIEVVKAYLWGKSRDKAETKKRTPLMKVMSCIFGLIRFPAMLREEDVAEYYDELVKVRDILTPFPASTAESSTAAYRIFDVIKDIYRREMEMRKLLEEMAKRSGGSGRKGTSSSPSREKPSDGDDTPDDAEPGEEITEGSGAPGEEESSIETWDDTDDGPEGEPEEETEDESSDETHDNPDTGGDGIKDDEPDGESPDEDRDSRGETGTGKETGDGAPGTEGDGNPEVTDGEVEKELSKDLDALDDLLSSLATKNGDRTLEDSDIAKSLKKDKYLKAQELEGLVEKGEGKAFFTKAPENESQYNNSLTRVRQYINPVRQALKYHCLESDISLKGMQNGLLDTSKLAEAVQGVSTVYMQERHVRCNRRAVCILIDESGSMNGDRERAARDTAILLNEALGSLKSVDLFIYGHTADVRVKNGTDLHVYREKGYCPKYALGSSEADWQNRDGDAIREVAARVRRQTKEHVLMFILSDGEPCADKYYGPAAITDTRKAVLKVTAMGFTPVQICIEASYDPSQMFDNYIIMDDMSTLAKELSKVIKDSLIKNIKRTTV